jgi:nucleotide-binding universal stress UspA family protein
MIFHHILVPLDFSEGSVRALRLAVGLARHGGAKLSLLHVGVVPHVYDTELAVVGVGPSVFMDLSEQIAAEQKHRMERLAKEEVPPGLETALLVREGFAPDEIISAITELQPDLVVMGTHGRTGLRRALLGSVTDRVLRQAEVPILVTR